MSGIYYTDLDDVLRAAGLAVAEIPTNAGWQTRARSSGGFPSPPLAVFWHHTASDTTPQNDLSYMIDGSDDAPIGNLLLDRDGVVWPIAAGASNCAGKGGPARFSRGEIPADQGNTRGWQIEVANNGVGEPWPAVQIDAYFTLSNALNAHVGNRPDDVITHGGPAGWAPDRKIDPATAAAVTGGWRPSSVSSSGTWALDDIRAELLERAGQPAPTPLPPPTHPGTPAPPPTLEDQSMVVALDANGTAWIGDGMTRVAIRSEAVFSNYVVLGKQGCYRFVNTSGDVVSGWGDVATVGDDTLNALGAPM